MSLKITIIFTTFVTGVCHFTFKLSVPEVTEGHIFVHVLPTTSWTTTIPGDSGVYHSVDKCITKYNS